MGVSSYFINSKLVRFLQQGHARQKHFLRLIQMVTIDSSNVWNVAGPFASQKNLSGGFATRELAMSKGSGGASRGGSGGGTTGGGGKGGSGTSGGAKGGGGSGGGGKGAGAPGGWPSTTGMPSGGGRGNAPPSK